MQNNDPINAYYNLLIAIIKQAIEDYFKGVLSEEGLESCLHNFFSDDSKVSIFMKEIKEIKERKMKYEKKKKQSSTKKRNKKFG